MSKEDAKKKVAEGKSAAKNAKKIGDKNKIGREAKRLQDKEVMVIAAELPAGQGNSFLKMHVEHGKAEIAIAAAQKWRRTVRASMKGIKIDMDAYNRVNKLAKMDPNDVKAKKTTEALYERTLGLETSPEQNALIDDINKKREDARVAMAQVNGGDTGKEIGSGSSEAGDDDDSLPERNDALSKSFQPAAGAH